MPPVQRARRPLSDGACKPRSSSGQGARSCAGRVTAGARGCGRSAHAQRALRSSRAALKTTCRDMCRRQAGKRAITAHAARTGILARADVGHTADARAGCMQGASSSREPLLGTRQDRGRAQGCSGARTRAAAAGPGGARPPSRRPTGGLHAPGRHARPATARPGSAAAACPRPRRLPRTSTQLHRRAHAHQTRLRECVLRSHPRWRALAAARHLSHCRDRSPACSLGPCRPRRRHAWPGRVLPVNSWRARPAQQRPASCRSRCRCRRPPHQSALAHRSRQPPQAAGRDRRPRPRPAAAPRDGMPRARCASTRQPLTLPARGAGSQSRPSGRPPCGRASACAAPSPRAQHLHPVRGLRQPARPSLWHAAAD